MILVVILLFVLLVILMLVYSRNVLTVVVALGLARYRLCFFFQAEDGIRDVAVTGVQTCALPISITIGMPLGIGPIVMVPSRSTSCGKRSCARWLDRRAISGWKPAGIRIQLCASDRKSVV